MQNDGLWLSVTARRMNDIYDSYLVQSRMYLVRLLQSLLMFSKLVQTVCLSVFES